jgi:Tfp pilus assembly protein PilF
MAIPSEKSTTNGAAPLTSASPFTGGWEPWVLPFLSLASIFCYANTLLNGFVYDDKIQILSNPYVKSWQHLPKIFGTTVWSFIGAAGDTNYYRPMMTFTYLLLWQAFGDLPSGYHLFNILLNTLVVAFVYLAGKELFKNWQTAAIAAALFAIHPIHTEPVAWIAGVPDLEATLLFVAAFFIYTCRPRLQLGTHVLIAVFYLAAILAKEPALLLASLLAYYEHFVRPGREQIPTPAKIRQYLPICVVGLGYLILRSLLFGKLAPVLQHPQVTSREAIFSAFALITSYTRLLFWPAPLSAFHTFHPSSSFWDPSVLIGAAIVLCCLFLLTYFHKTDPRLSFCVLWIGLTLGPVLNVRWMAANVLTERYLYLPSIAFCWLAGSAARHLWLLCDTRQSLRIHGRALLAIVGLVLAGLGTSNIVLRNQVWRDDLTLYTTTLRTDPDSYVMHLNLGTTYLAEQNFAAAEKELQVALTLKRDSPNVLDALGCVYLEQGKLQDSAAVLKAAISRKPKWTDPHFNYGRVLRKLSLHDAALAEFRTAVEFGPLNASARFLLAEELAERGSFSEAESEFLQSIQLAPSLTAQKELADLFLKTGKENSAAELLQRTAEQYPYDSETHLKFARLLEAKQKRLDAENQYRAVLVTDPANAEALAAITRLSHP